MARGGSPARRTPSHVVIPTLVATAIWLVGCGDDGAGPEDASLPDSSLPDSSAPDAAIDGGPSGPLFARLEGEAYAVLGAPYCVTAVHNGGADAEVSVTWGAEGTEPVVDDAACHTFATPGERLVSIVVLARGMRTDDSRAVPVVFALASPPPTHSSPIAYDAMRDRVWVVNPDADTVAVIADSAASGEPPALLREIAVGDRPRTLAVAGGVIAVACQEDDTLYLIDADTLDVREVVDLGYGSAPYGVAADPRGARVWVSRLSSADLVAVDVPSGVLRRDVDLGPDPRGVAIAGDGTIFVTRWRSDLSSAYVYQVDAGDPAAPVVVGQAMLPRQEGLDSDTDNDGVLSFLNQAVFSPDAARVVLPALKANVVAGLFNTSAELTTQTTARGVLAELLRDPAAPRTIATDSFRVAFDDLDYASALVFSPAGDRVFVAFQGGESILELDAFSFGITGSIQSVGAAPQGLSLSPDGARLFVQNFLDREVRVYDVTDLSIAPLPIATIGTVASEPLPPLVLEGKRIFYRAADPRMSRTSYLSCASCHLDGEGDNLVWDFTQRGEGLRNTIPLRGRAGTGHGPLHWSANFDEVQDFEHDIRGGQGGAGFMDDEDLAMGTRGETLGDPKAGVSAELDALAAYVTSLTGFGRSPFRRDGDAGFEAAFARGQAVFERTETACATCHVAPTFTDSAFTAPATPRLHDVGTLGAGSGSRLGDALSGIDTPTLRGLFRSAPYLHDGSAPTLRAVLTTRNTTDAHGVTSTLSADELDDLLVFLRALDDAVP